MMEELSCQVVRDLLPLYHDGVCSEDSRALVASHLAACQACRAELEKMDKENPSMENLDEARLLQQTAKTWKKNKTAAFFKGAMIVAAAACAACLAAFNLIGSHVEPDGRLVEAFGFIPIAWLFALLTAVFAVFWLIFRRKK